MHFHVILHTFSPSLPIPPPISRQIVQSTLSRSRCSNQLAISVTLFIPKKIQIHTALFVFQRHSTHPSYHHPLRPLSDYADFQPSPPMYQSHTSTHSEHKLCVSFPLRIEDNSLNLAQEHLTLTLSASSTPPPTLSVINVSVDKFNQCN